MDFVVRFGVGGISCLFFRCFSTNAHGLLQVSMGMLCLDYLPTNDEARPGERSDRGWFLPVG